MRLFSALSLPSAVVDHLSSLISAFPHPPPTRWVPPANLHVTLNFFGPVRDAEVPALTAALRQVRAAAPGDLWPSHMEFFPPTLPHVISAGLSGDVPALQHLHQQIAAVVQPLGFAPERRAYVPHITLGRSDPGWRSELTGSTPDLFPGPHFTPPNWLLMESLSTPLGPAYHPIATFPFTP